MRQLVVEQIQGHPKSTFFESLQCHMGPILHQLSYSKISYYMIHIFTGYNMALPLENRSREYFEQNYLS